MKRTCEGCRAFDSDGHYVKCDLGYKQKKIWGKVFKPNTARPLEECPKPRTYERLMMQRRKPYIGKKGEGE